MNLKNWTGERLETFVNSEVAVEHLHRYALVLSLVKNKKVLDIASGEGYGSNLIADVASEVTGVDISHDTISRANAKYKKNNLNFIEGSAAAIPLPNSTFDVVVSFETIEHHHQHDEMLSEIKRVLKPGGLLIISSPDKLYYSDKRNFDNKFHVKELYENEFKQLIKQNFINARFYYQKATFVSMLIPDGQQQAAFKEYTGSYDEINEKETFGQLYILAIASESNLPEIGISAFTDDELVFRMTDQAIEKVRKTASYKIGHYMLWPFKKLKNVIKKNNTGKV